MIYIPTKKYAALLSARFQTENLIDYIERDIIKYNTIEPLDLKYLRQRMNQLNVTLKQINDEEQN